MRIECGGLTFISDFDSANLAKVELVSESNKLTVGDKSCTNLSSPSYVNKTHGRKNASRSSTAGHSEPNEGCKEVKTGLRGSPSNVSNKDSTSQKISSSSSVSSSPPTKSYLHSPTFKRHFKVLEFNVWTKPDCAGTPFENTFRSWFHFGIESCMKCTVVKISVMNLNQQGKLYFHGMQPVYRVIPGKESWRRIPGKVQYRSEIDGNFVISFSHPLPNQSGSIIYFAFTYPFTYTDCMDMLDNVEKKVESSLHVDDDIPPENSIYFCRELLCHSLDGRRVELLTISSFKGFTKEREERLPYLFPDHSKPRCHIFCDKKVIFLSSRVHPGETPSSFVFNGFLRTLLCTKDPKANRLRHLFVFKLIPLLNPDGVWRGHFRTDSRGVNLNRTYLIATPENHPSVFASRSLLLYYHNLYATPQIDDAVLKENQNIAFGKSALDNSKYTSRKPSGCGLLRASSEAKLIENCGNDSEFCIVSSTSPSTTVLTGDVLLDRSMSASDLITGGKQNLLPDPTHTLSRFSNKSYLETNSLYCSASLHSGSTNESPKTNFTAPCGSQLSVDMTGFRSGSDFEASDIDEELLSSPAFDKNSGNPTRLLTNSSPEASGISYYIDLHGHACKRGCFIYGNYFADIEQKVECMLLAKLMSINSPYFDFPACNFSAENMRSGGKKDGLNKEGSGRVSLNTFTGIIHSYTLECNYNTCRSATNCEGSLNKPVEYFSPETYEQVGEALLISILDASGRNPNSYIPFSAFGSVQGVKDWLRNYILSAHSKNKSDFLKKNILNLKMGKYSSKGKLPMTSPAPLLKFAVTSSQQRTAGPRNMRLALNVKRNLKSTSSLSNEKFLADFETQYKRLHTSNSSLDHLRTSTKCFGSLKNLFSPKVKTFGPTKSSAAKSTIAQQRKGKANKTPPEKATRPPSREPSTESLMENRRVPKNVATLNKIKTKERTLEELKTKKIISASSFTTSRKIVKVKKKGSLPNFPSCNQDGPTNLLKQEGNIRMKKAAKTAEKHQ